MYHRFMVKDKIFPDEKSSKKRKEVAWRYKTPIYEGLASKESALVK